MGVGRKVFDIAPHALQGGGGGEKARLPEQEGAAAQEKDGQNQGRSPLVPFHTASLHSFVLPPKGTAEV